MKIFGSISELVDLAFRLAGGKQVKLKSRPQDAALSASVTTVYVPDVKATGDQDIVLEKADQTLLNKKLTAPIISGAGGSINSTPIGVSVPAAGSFTTINGQSATVSGTTSTVGLTLNGAITGILHSTDGVVSSSEIVNADISASADIELSKLESISQSQLLIGDASGEIVPLGLSAGSQLEISYLSTENGIDAFIKDGAILNVDINANADIAPSKIKASTNGLPMVSDKTTGVLRVNAGLTDDAVLVWDTDTGDFASITSVTSTELGYLDGVSSGIQGQLDGKASSGANSDITSLSNLTTALSGAQGGTGVANTNKTITLGGNLATSGNFTTTITSTNDTNVTLPTSGTLATLSGVETFTNKSLSHLKVPTNTGVISGGVLVLSNGTMVINAGENVLNSFNTTSLAGFNNGSFITLINNEGADITISNNASIQTGTGEDYTLKNGATVSLVYSSTVGKWLLSGGAGAGSSAGASKEITQANSFAEGNVVYFDGTNYVLASNTAANLAEAIGVVSAASATKFTVTELGYMEGLSGLTPGEVYFLDNAGGLTAVEPTTVGSVSKPMLIAVSATAGFVLNYRGVVVGSANARTQITLSNNTTATVQNVDVYDAGELAGWVYIDATTDYRFYVQAQFAKNGAGNNYNLSYQTTGDTPPAGFSLSVTAAGLIQYTMPSVTGFASAVINYALNAPAVGTNFPLSIDGSAVTSGTVSASNLPVAGVAAAGIVTTGTQTFAGTKSFISDIIANSGAIEVGAGRATDGPSYIDFTSQAGSIDYNARIIRESGANGNFQFIQNGTGVTYFTAGGNARFEINSSTVKVHALAGSGNRAVYSDAVGQLTNSSSDATLKTDVKSIAQGLDCVLSLNPVNFKWIDENRFGAQREIGFLAQEVEPLIPEVIGTNNDGTLSVDYPKMVAVLVKAIQEQQAIIDDLRSRVESLEG